MTQEYTSAAETVFGIPELFEQILQHLSVKELFSAQCVSQTFNYFIQSSIILRRIMFLSPLPLGTVVPISVSDRPLRGKVPRSKTIWIKTPIVEAIHMEPFIVRGRSDRLPAKELERLYAENEVPRPLLNPILKYRQVNWKLDTILLKHSPITHADRALRLVPRTMDASFADSRRNMLITQPPVADVVIGRSDTLWGLYEAHNPNGVTIGDVLEAEERTYNPERSFQGTAFIGWS